jgi:hypothetical protein
MFAAVFIHIVLLHAQMVSPIVGTRRTPPAVSAVANYRAFVLRPGQALVLRPGISWVLNYK